MTVTVETEARHPADFHAQGVTIVYRICKTFDFEAAHHLPGLPEGHKCGRVHGHSYRAEVWIAAHDVDHHGFVVDFADLTPIGDYLDQVADHRNLNDLIDQPTSENLAEHLYEWVVANIALPDSAWVDRVRVSETAKSWAEYSPTVTA